MESAGAQHPLPEPPFLPFGLRPQLGGRTWRVGSEPLDELASIGVALARAVTGDRILVGPGLYREELLELVVPIEVVARLGRGSVIIEAIDHDGFHIVGDSRLRGLEVRRLGAPHPEVDSVAAVAVVAGRPIIEDCTLSAPAANGHGLLAVTPLARPVLDASSISDCAGIGALALGGATITAINGSVIADCDADGLMAGGPNSRLVLADAFVRHNGGSGAILDAGAVGAMDRVEFAGNGRAGAWVSGPHSILRLEQSISRNQGVGVAVGPGAEALLRHVTIAGNVSRGVLVDGARARAIIEESSLDGAEIGLVVQNGATAWSLHNAIHSATMAGISVLGHDTLLESERGSISKVEQFGILVSEGASAHLTAQQISECGYGLVVKTDHQGRVRLLGSDIFGNEQGLMIHSGQVKLEGNRIRLNRGFGLFKGAGVWPAMRSNDIHDNGIDIKREDGHWLARAFGWLNRWRQAD